MGQRSCCGRPRQSLYIIIPMSVSFSLWGAPRRSGWSSRDKVCQVKPSSEYIFGGNDLSNQEVVLPLPVVVASYQEEPSSIKRKAAKPSIQLSWFSFPEKLLHLASWIEIKCWKKKKTIAYFMIHLSARKCGNLHSSRRPLMVQI